MFRSGLTKGMYERFLRSHHLNKAELASAPFLFVDPSKGNVKLLTNLISHAEEVSDFYALSMGGDGDVEVLSTENSLA